MNRRTVVVSVAIVILMIFAVLFVEITTQPSYTNRVGCTDYEVTVIQASTITNGSGVFQTFQTESNTAIFTTMTNYSATVGHTIVSTIGPKAEFGTAEVYVTGSCTFVK